MDDLPSIKQVIKKYDLAPKKSLGQNFIIDPNLLDKIVSYAGDLKNKTIIEIGPGPGGLTRSILRAGPKKLIVIEKDKRCIEALNELQKHYDNLEIIEEDALKFDFNTSKKIKVIANLPYNIGTQILLNFYKNLKNIESLTLMFQKEVAKRIIASPNNKQYGRLSIISQLLCEVEIEFDIDPEAFIPPPKVTSSVINVIPRKQPLYDADISKVEKLTQLIFSQRRKTLGKILKKKIDPSIFEKLDIDPKLRPENLSLKQIHDLSSNS